eukprot:663077-Rhodomonas_salina.1
MMIVRLFCLRIKTALVSSPARPGRDEGRGLMNAAWRKKMIPCWEPSSVRSRTSKAPPSPSLHVTQCRGGLSALPPKGSRSFLEGWSQRCNSVYRTAACVGYTLAGLSCGM